MKKLIAYFSHRGMNYAPGGLVELKVGNTERAAGLISKLTGVAPFEIRAEHEYPFDYRECVEVSKRELSSGARPALAVQPQGIEEADALILCYPCWCGTMPMPVWTFLESADLSGKRIFPLCTNEGSGMGRSESDIAKLCPTAKVEAGLSVKGSAVESAGPQIEAWLKTAGLI